GIVYVIWDVDRNRLVSETPIATANGREADWVYVALSPDGKQFVSWAYQHTPGPAPKLDPKDDPTRTITVRDADTGKPVHQITPPGPAAGKRVCFSPDSRTLAVMGRELELWDTAKWQARARVKGLTSGHWPRGDTVAFSPDGKRLAVLSADGSVELRDGATGERLALVKGYAPGHALRFVANDRAVVLGGGERTFRVW